MAIYIGGQKCKLLLRGVSHQFNIFSSLTNLSDIILLSSDGYSLVDSEGFSLASKPSVPIIIEGTTLSTSEDYTLKDLNGFYLTLKEDE